MDLVLSALLIFSMRVVDVSFGTLRIVTLVQGRRLAAGGLGFVESLMWVLAASQVIGNLDDPIRILVPWRRRKVVDVKGAPAALVEESTS